MKGRMCCEEVREVVLRLIDETGTDSLVAVTGLRAAICALDPAAEDGLGQWDDATEPDGD